MAEHHVGYGRLVDPMQIVRMGKVVADDVGLTVGQVFELEGLRMSPSAQTPGASVASVSSVIT